MRPEGDERQDFRELLHRLARSYNVATEYWGQSGNHVQVADEIIIEVLAALGIHAPDRRAIERELNEVHFRDWRKVIPPVFITWVGEQRRLWVHVPHGEPVEAHVVLEDGNVFRLSSMDWWVDPVEVDGVLTGEASFAVPGDLPIGWHRIEVSSPSVQAQCPLAVAPAALDPAAIAGERQWGLMVQIYSWPSRASWGVGDCTDLATLATWSAAEHGAGFVLVNPCHAPVAQVPSPYLPSSRRFWNPLMIRPEAILEYRDLDSAARGRIEIWREQAQGDVAAGSPATRIDRSASWHAMRRALKLIFDGERSATRERDFEQFSTSAALQEFAAWNVLADRYGHDFRDWPESLRNPASDEVAAFVHEHTEDVRFEMWLQWIIAGQLTDTQQQCRAAGMPIGVLSDLAVGVHPGGADAWALSAVLAPRVGVGAPPDMYNQQGQNWDQPPWHPGALADQAFAPFRDVLRASLHGAGGVRIDHILGLFRMWWVPQGRPATEGTYVGFDHDALLAIVCLEAHQAGAVVIGEDLGTVEPWVQNELARRGILGTVISWFERTQGGTPTPVEHWRSGVLASVTVHDLPPTAGYLAGEHVRIRAELDLLAGDVDREWSAAFEERNAWAQLLRDRGALSYQANLDTAQGREEMVVALHRVLAQSPCLLIGVGAPDLLGDVRAQNQPGTDQEYPNWQMPIADRTGSPVFLDDFLSRPPNLATDILGAVRR